jgi:hypothetical protein
MPTRTRVKNIIDIITDNYLMIITMFFLPIAGSIFILMSDDTNSSAPGLPRLGIIAKCLLICILLTIAPVIMALALVGFIANSFFGAGALIIAKISDWIHGPLLTEENTVLNSTPMSLDSQQVILSALNHDNNSDFERAITASLEQPTTASQETPPSCYSTHLNSYLKSRIGKETFPQKIASLIKRLSDKSDKLTNDDLKELKKFIDPITCELIAIPVSLNEKIYDLSTLNKINKDPYTGEVFTPPEIQSGCLVIMKFDRKVARIEQDHGITPRDNITSDMESTKAVSMR